MKDRLHWIDTTKVLAIVLVLFTHILESFYDNGINQLLPMIKYVHSFVLFFFFLSSGFFLAPKAKSFRDEFKYRFTVRVIPVLAFGLIFIPLTILLEHNAIKSEHVLGSAALYIVGLPVLDWTTWFLVVLFTSELICYFVPPQKSIGFVLAAALLLYSLGWWMSEIAPKLVYLIGAFWFFKEALIVSSIMILGRLLKPVILAVHARGYLAVFACFLVFFVLTLLTYDLNQVVVASEEHRPVIVDRATVIMAISRHGHSFWFYFTGMMGGLMCVFFGMLVPSFKPIPYLGRNTLLLIGLVGFYFHFVNEPVVESLALEDKYHALGVGLAFALAQLVLCIPAIWLLDKYFPQLFGKPTHRGPLLPPLLGPR